MTTMPTMRKRDCARTTAASARASSTGRRDSTRPPWPGIPMTPTRAACWAWSTMQQGRPELAVEWIGRAVAIRPDMPGYHASLGLALQSLGRAGRGRRGLRRAAGAHARTTPRPTSTAGSSSGRSAIESAALAHFRRAVELDPTPGPGPDQPRCAPRRSSAGPSEALPHCQAAVALEPGLVEARINLGDASCSWTVGRTPGRASTSRPYRLDPSRGPGRRRPRPGRGPRWTSGTRRLDWLRRAVELEPRFGRIPPLPRGGRRHAPELYPEVKACCERILEHRSR